MSRVPFLCALAATLGCLAVAPVADARPAYVALFGAGDLAAMEVASDGTPTPIAGSPFDTTSSSSEFVTLTPDGAHVFVDNVNSDNISTFDVAADGTLSNRRNVATPDAPRAIGISPDGAHLFLAGQVVGVDPATATVYDVAADGSLSNRRDVTAPRNAFGLAVSPDGEHVFVAGATEVASYDVAADGSLTNRRNAAVPALSEVAAITPDGRHLYVTTIDPTPGAPSAGEGVSVFDVAADGSLSNRRDITGMGDQFWANVTPDGEHLYVADADGPGDLRVYDIAADGSLGNERVVDGGTGRLTVSVSPDGRRLAAADVEGDRFLVYDIAPDGAVSNERSLALQVPTGIAFRPNQPPTAAFGSSPAPSGSPTTFDATGSTDPDGTPARFSWNFGDGSTAADGGAQPQHTYADAGTYTVTLTVTDNEGCSANLIWNTILPFCNGGPSATTSRTVEIREPDVDGDGVVDRSDNCRTTPNADQVNSDQGTPQADAEGDACDADDDGDGHADADDNCRTIQNRGLSDADRDGIGTACDPSELFDGRCANVLSGTSAGETLSGTIAGDAINARAGNDSVLGNAGDDCLSGDEGRDDLRGGAGADSLTGDAGDDRLYGDDGADALSGGPGNDRIKGGRGVNRYFGRSGNDSINARNGEAETVNCGTGRDSASVDADDRVKSCEQVSRGR